MKRITVLFAEDQGFRFLLEHERAIEVVGEAGTGRRPVQLSRKLRPAVVVMDIAMPLLNRAGSHQADSQSLSDTKVLILSAHGDDAYVSQVAALGAAGFLLKQTSSHVLTTAIREILKGNTFFSPTISWRIRKRRELAERGGGSKTAHNRLSSREVEVLQLIAEGKPNKQVAVELGVSFKTVDKHRQHLMAKLNIHDTAGLTRYA